MDVSGDGCNESLVLVGDIDNNNDTLWADNTWWWSRWPFSGWAMWCRNWAQGQVARSAGWVLNGCLGCSLLTVGRSR